MVIIVSVNYRDIYTHAHRCTYIYVHAQAYVHIETIYYTHLFTHFLFLSILFFTENYLIINIFIKCSVFYSIRIGNFNIELLPIYSTFATSLKRLAVLYFVPTGSFSTLNSRFGYWLSSTNKIVYLLCRFWLVTSILNCVLLGFCKYTTNIWEGL